MCTDVLKRFSQVENFSHQPEKGERARERQTVHLKQFSIYFFVAQDTLSKHNNGKSAERDTVVKPAKGI